jgi:hypothetical protein
MRACKTVLCLGVALCSMTWSQAADASPIYTQNVSINSGVVSDAGNAVVAADDFSLLTANTIASVTWRGAHMNTATPAADAFTINFYAQASGEPGALLGSFLIGNAVNTTNTGLTVFGANVYEYSANLGGGGFSAAAGTPYWIAIFDNSGFLTDEWIWGVQTSQTMPPSYRVSFTSSGSPDSFDFVSGGATYFSLDSAPVTIASAPEPSSILLAVTGLVALIVRLRR